MPYDPPPAVLKFTLSDPTEVSINCKLILYFLNYLTPFSCLLSLLSLFTFVLQVKDNLFHVPSVTSISDLLQIFDFPLSGNVFKIKNETLSLCNIPNLVSSLY